MCEVQGPMKMIDGFKQRTIKRTLSSLSFLGLIERVTRKIRIGYELFIVASYGNRARSKM
jgi:hypothetical protein